MKSLLTLLVAISLTSAIRAQPIPLPELVGPDNQIRDQLYGLSVTYPAGWQVRAAQRWGKNNKENTILLRPIWPVEAQPSLYYQPVSNTDYSNRETPEAYFRRTAGTKATSRVANGLSDYRNLEDSFEFTQINGRPAFRYLASFSMNGNKHLEYFIRLIGEQMMVMFFVMGPAEEIQAIRGEVDQMSATMQVP